MYMKYDILVLALKGKNIPLNFLFGPRLAQCLMRYCVGNTSGQKLLEVKQ